MAGVLLVVALVEIAGIWRYMGFKTVGVDVIVCDPRVHSERLSSLPLELKKPQNQTRGLRARRLAPGCPAELVNIARIPAR